MSGARNRSTATERSNRTTSRSLASRPRTRRVATLCVVALAAVALLAVASGPAAADHTGGDGVDDYVAVQGDRCVELSALGDGTTSAEAFYDYRWNTSRWGEPAEFSSHGTTHLQERDVAQVFLYHGEDGLSLVFLNDKLEDEGADTEHGNGGSITVEIEGLPEGGQFPVMNDDYPESEVSGGENHDRLQHDGSTAQIDWAWTAGRTTGAVFTGVEDLGSDSIDVDPRFAGDSYLGGTLDYDYAQHENAWAVRHGGGDGELVAIENDQRLSIRRGTCGDDPSPEPLEVSLDATPATVTAGETVTLDASAEGGADGEYAYEWDLDGDGTVDERTTGEATITREFDEAGTVAPTVTVVDADDATATGSASVTVEPRVDVTARASPDDPVVEPGESIGFDGTASTTDGEIASYEWVFGDGTTADGPEPTHAFEEPGSYQVELLVTTESGRSDSDVVTVTVESLAPEADLAVPDSVSVGDSITLDASGSTAAGSIERYRWDLGADGTVDEESGEPTLEHTAAEAGERSVRVTVVDDAGATDAATVTYQVSAAEDDSSGGAGGSGTGGTGGGAADDGATDDGSVAPGSSGAGWPSRVLLPAAVVLALTAGLAATVRTLSA